MELAGLTHEAGARSVAARRPNGARDRRAGKLRGPAVRTESLAPAPHPPAVPAEESVAPRPDAADQLQADYFLRLLAQNRRLIDHRIDGYRKAIAAAEAKGDVEGVVTFRRTVVGEEQDRRVLDAMIESLRRRFPRRS